MDYIEFDGNYIFAAAEKRAQANQEMARKIAKYYVKHCPRKKSYGVQLESSEDDTAMTIYHRLTRDELRILREYKASLDYQDEIMLCEYLESKGYTDLLDKLLEHSTPFQLDLLIDCDLNHPLKFTQFTMRILHPDGTMGDARKVSVPLTDEQYVDLLARLLEHHNCYSLNMLVSDNPDLAKHIMHHLCVTEGVGFSEMCEPFVCEMTELKEVTESILNPIKDKLKLFEDVNLDVRDFAYLHQIVPDYTTLYEENDHGKLFHCVADTVGKSLVVYQEGCDDDFNQIERETFSIGIRKAMRRFHVSDLDSLFKYLKEHYTTRDSLDRIRKDLS